MREDTTYQDPPVGVSWLNYPTLPIGFQTGHPLGPGIKPADDSQIIPGPTGNFLYTGAMPDVSS